jgi:hypothetical protein
VGFGTMSVEEVAVPPNKVLATFHPDRVGHLQRLMSTSRIDQIPHVVSDYFAGIREGRHPAGNDSEQISEGDDGEQDVAEL